MIIQQVILRKSNFIRGRILLVMAVLILIVPLLQSCKPDNPPTKNPIRYEIDEFIFNTFLFAQGSWWALVDTVSGDRDTLMITYSAAQHQNVYEGSEFKYYRFYYESKLWSTSDQEQMTMLYRSNSFSGHANSQLQQVIFYRNGRPWHFFYKDLNIGDSMSAGGIEQIDGKKIIYFSTLSAGDSLNHWKKGWKIGKYIEFKHSNVYFKEFADLKYMFQEHEGIVSYDNGSHYLVEDKYLIPIIR